jgi:protein-tyrosine kinase
LSTDENHAHLIERAAARLGLPVRDTAAAPRPPSEASSIGADVRRLTGIDSPGLEAEHKPSGLVISADALEKTGLADLGHRHSRIAEEFRIVRNRLLREGFGGSTAGSSRGNLVLITSALPKEGKSFISINLAAGIAEQGERRVLLVDIDVKPTSLGHVLGISAAPGLLDLLRSSARSIEEFVMPTVVENLAVLPLGGDTEQSSELFVGKRMAELIESLGRRYPNWFILFDAPPCLLSSIPHSLAPLMGQIVVVVAAGSTQQGDVEATLDLLQSCPRVSLLLNKIPPWNVHSFSAYGYPASPGSPS